MHIVQIIGIGGLALATLSLHLAIGNAPAFNKTQRGETVYGAWQVDNLNAMYDPASYHFQLGRSYLLADVIFSAETEASNELANSETALERARTARSEFHQSLSHAPGNAYVWADLAMAELMLGDTEAAEASIQRSWDLAPYNRALAERRLIYLQVLEETGAEIPAEIRAATSRDLSVLLAHARPRFVDSLIANSPFLAAERDRLTLAMPE